MKLLSFSILLGFLLITLNYVWINRISVIKQTELSSVLMNKWTGKHCVFFDSRKIRYYNIGRGQQIVCDVDDNGKIKFP